MNDVKRVLIYGMTENPGGLESVVMNYYRLIDRDKIQFDFIIGTDSIAYEEEIVDLGGRIFRVSRPSEGYFEYKKKINAFYKEHAKEYSAFWMNVNVLVNMDYIKYAKKYDIPTRIIHGHNSKNMAGKVHGSIHLINRIFANKYATDYWACSETAADWTFVGKGRSDAHIVNNAIDVKRYAYDAKAREDIRSILGIDKECLVIGNVGRLHFQKNQSFILDIFSEVLKKRENSLLVLVGQGEDEDLLRKKCEDLAIDKKVFFALTQADVRAWLSAFDVFLFPSQFEGFGLALIEAEANGLPSMASSGVIPKETAINENVIYERLDSSPKEWANRLINLNSDAYRLSNEQVAQNFKNSGFDISIEVKEFEKMLLEA